VHTQYRPRGSSGGSPHLSRRPVTRCCSAWRRCRCLRSLSRRMLC